MMKLSIGESIYYYNAFTIRRDLAFPLKRRCAEDLDKR